MLATTAECGRSERWQGTRSNRARLPHIAHDPAPARPRCPTRSRPGKKPAVAARPAAGKMRPARCAPVLPVRAAAGWWSETPTAQRTDQPPENRAGSGAARPADRGNGPWCQITARIAMARNRSRPPKRPVRCHAAKAALSRTWMALAGCPLGSGRNQSPKASASAQSSARPWPSGVDINKNWMDNAFIFAMQRPRFRPKISVIPMMAVHFTIQASSFQTNRPVLASPTAKVDRAREPFKIVQAKRANTPKPRQAWPTRPLGKPSFAPPRSYPFDDRDHSA